MDEIRTRLAACWPQISCRLQQARRARRGQRELAQMSAQELLDLGISHAAMAGMAPRTDLPC